MSLLPRVPPDQEGVQQVQKPAHNAQVDKRWRQKEELNKMAKKGKKGRRSKRTKSIPILATAGTASCAMDIYNTTKGVPMDEKLRYAVRSTTGFDIKGEVPWSGDSISGSAKMMWGGILLSTIAPKIPVIRTLPKKIPIIGKYLRW